MSSALASRLISSSFSKASAIAGILSVIKLIYKKGKDRNERFEEIVCLVNVPCYYF